MKELLAAGQKWKMAADGWWLQRLCTAIMDHIDVWMKDGTVNEQLCSLIQLRNNISLQWDELSQTTVKEAKIELVLADKDSWQHSWQSAFKMLMCARGQVRWSPKWLGVIHWGTWTSTVHFIMYVGNLASSSGKYLWNKMLDRLTNGLTNNCISGP